MWSHFDSDTTFGVHTYVFLLIWAIFLLNAFIIEANIQNWDQITFETNISADNLDN